MEDERNKEKVANTDEKDQAEDIQRLMPYFPRFHPPSQRLLDGISVNGTAQERHSPEHDREEELVPFVNADAEGLQEIQDQEDNDTINHALSEPMAALLERISAIENEHVSCGLQYSNTKMGIQLDFFFAHVFAKITTIIHATKVSPTNDHVAVIVSSPGKMNVKGARMISNPPTKPRRRLMLYSSRSAFEAVL